MTLPIRIAKGLLNVVALATALASSSAGGVGAFSLTDEINRRFDKSARAALDETPLLNSALRFTQAACQTAAASEIDGDERSFSADRRGCAGTVSRARLEDDAASFDAAPTPVEQLIDEGYPTGKRRLHVERNETRVRLVSFMLTRGDLPLTPERDPRYVSGPRVVAIDGVAMRFQDEVPHTFALGGHGGVTFYR